MISDKLLSYPKEIANVLMNYWPSCDEAYFHGVFADGGYSCDAFFEKEGMLLRKNLVTYFDLIDCHQPRNLDDQKILMEELMQLLKEWEAAFYEEYNVYFYSVELNFYRVEGKPKVKCHFCNDENILEDVKGGAHELHQRYFKRIEKTLNAGKKR